MPVHEWIVIPFKCVAAIPVDAVTAGIIPACASHSIYRLNMKVLPLPAGPVINTFFPDFNIANACSCVIVLIYSSFYI